MNIKNFAAIDIGSNAIRLLISYAIEEEGFPTKFKKYSLVRVPIRLGEDVFLHKKVSDKNTKRLIKAMKSFSLIMDVYNVEDYRACATSAMREASNAKQLVTQISEQANISVEIIDGKDEANIIAANYLNAHMDDDKNYLYVDVGGGSTEFTVYHKGQAICSKSFKIGTLRLLNNKITDQKWEEVKIWIKKNTKNLDNISLVGSGGNINKIFKVSGKKRDTQLSFNYLKKFYKMLLSYSYEERIRILQLHPDRADVITPASLIFLNAMKWSCSNKIYVPEIGLSDGIIKDLYLKKKKGN